MRSIFQLLILWAVWMLVQPAAIFAQPDQALLRSLAEENKKSVEALVLYPNDTRLAILEATKYPEVLIKMQDIRTNTSAVFRTLIEDFPRTTQAFFYDLNRYPGLTEALVLHQNDKAAIRKDLEVLPAEKRESSFDIVNRLMLTLVQINHLNQTTNQAFNRLTSGYPAPAKQAFEQLLGLPEVVDLLNEDLRFTILVGDTYKADPAWVIYKMDSLNLAVARAHADELEDWKEALNSDPDAQTEMKAAAREYATEYGYTVEEYDGDDLYGNGDYYDRDNDIIVRHYYQPYPYWYGYPWWEPYPRWHPYPWWWDWGCQFQPHSVVIVYMPSYHFMHWYFDHPKHHDHYNHLSTHFVNHYTGHRRSGTTISEGVRDWKNNNRSLISDAYLADKPKVSQHLREYAKFEDGRQSYNTRNPQKPVSPENYLDQNRSRYPDLERSREGAKNEMKIENAEQDIRRSNWAPSKPTYPPTNPPSKVPDVRDIDRKPSQPVQKTTPPAPPRAPRPATNTPAKPDEAKDYHRQQWEQQKTPPQDVRRSNPAPVQKRESTVPKTQNPSPRKESTTPQDTKKRGGGN